MGEYRELEEQELEEVSGGKLKNNPMNHGCNSNDFLSTLEFYGGGAICQFCKHYNKKLKTCKKKHNNLVFVAPPSDEVHSL